MLQEEFTVKGYEQYQFRVAKMNAIEVLALETQFRFTDMAQSEIAIKCALERTEVKVGDKWIPVKMKDKEVYTPDLIEEDVKLVGGIVGAFHKKVITDVFQKSEESR